MPMLVSVFVIPPPRTQQEIADAVENRYTPSARPIGVLDTPVLPVPGDTIAVIDGEGPGEPTDYRVVQRIFGVNKPAIITPDPADQKLTLHDISLLVVG